MREITRKAIDAFLAGNPVKTSNTTVEVRPFQREDGDSVILKLHGNPIARYRVADRILWVCDGQHQTATTKDRLNGLPGVRVNQRNWDWYLNGVEWDGSWSFVGPVGH